MATVKKKPKLTLPPAAAQVDEKAMKAMIEKGGSVTSDLDKPKEVEEDPLKSFTIKLYESELAQIRAIQDSMPKRDRISIHDFIVTAVQAKLKKANVTT